MSILKGSDPIPLEGKHFSAVNPALLISVTVRLRSRASRPDSVAPLREPVARMSREKFGSV